MSKEEQDVFDEGEPRPTVKTRLVTHTTKMFVNVAEAASILSMSTDEVHALMGGWQVTTV